MISLRKRRTVVVRTYSLELDGKTITIEHGRMAAQADGAVVVRSGDSMVLVTACMSPSVPNLPFFPLTVEYREKGYAAGKIPGSIFKREGKPSDEETLSARLIDHQIRPLFPKAFQNEVQVIVSVLSHDQENDPDVLACVGASAALSISKIPFAGPYGTVRVAADPETGNKIINPTYEQRENSDRDMVVAGNAESLLNIEGEAHEISEAEMLDSMTFAIESIKKLVDFQAQIVSEVGQPKVEVAEPEVNQELVKRVEDLAADRIRESLTIAEKSVREDAQEKIIDEAVAALADDYPTEQKEIADVISAIAKREMRNRILKEGTRIDGRDVKTVRDITIETGFLPRAHGSALFSRGQTQALASVTLGTRMDERLVDNLEGKSYKNYMLDYNFPPFSTGEVKRIGPPSRRDIGHGALAERAIESVIPDDKSFPYTIRVVSDIMESNGSSSMATVCAASLALMDAGVPIKTAVAGINIGLITDKDSGNTAILTDLLGIEDANGDMDLKIAGTRDGITAFQMDIKIGGIAIDTMREAFDRAHDGRLHVLNEMVKAIEAPRAQLSRFAPRIITMNIDPSQIGAVIGPGGKIVREIQESTGATVEIEDDGTITISSLDGESGEAAAGRIKGIVSVPEIGEKYHGTVKSIMPYGAFVEIMPGRDGLLHISEIEERRLDKVEDVLTVGDEIEVIVMNVEANGKLRLSHKRLEASIEELKAEAEKSGSSSGGGGSRGGRGGSRGGGRR
ncbi:MAG TPA: polyribonucleotide nucleotidyltransferase [Firmicutes bacterium]|nr:polyribonucleotide nucleotidyltransferase [Bacillota bacterium]